MASINKISAGGATYEIEDRSSAVKAGDTVSGQYYTAGFVTSSGTEMYFSIPFSRNIESIKVTVNSLKLIGRQNGEYITGTGTSDWSEVTGSSEYNIIAVANSMAVRFRVVKSSAYINVTNNDAVGINVAYNLTFS